MEFNEDAPLAISFKRKRIVKQKKESQGRLNKPSQPACDLEPAKLLPAVADAPPEILVSKFYYSIENHLKFVDTMTKLCGYQGTVDGNQAETKRFSNSITFLREWRDFYFEPRIVWFVCQHNSEEKDVIGGDS